MITNSFQNLSSLNDYYIGSFESDDLFMLNSHVWLLIKTGNIDIVNEDLTYNQDQYNDIITDGLGLNVEEYEPPANCYIYIGSKTDFRLSVHTMMVDSLYKKFYNALKKFGYIVEATGSYVALKKEPLHIDVFNEIKSSIPDLTTLDNFVAYIKELESDTKYYSKIITVLNEKIDKQEKQIRELSSEASNNFLSTWS